MKIFLSLKRHCYFLLFIVLFTYIETIYFRLLNHNVINYLTFTPDAAIGTLIQITILYFFIFTLLVKWKKNKSLIHYQSLIAIFIISILMYLVTLKSLELLVAVVFNTVSRNFNQKTFFITLFSDFLKGFIYGSFLLTYYFILKSFNYKNEILNVQKANSSRKIELLKSQLNPHFLFNNLNVLDQLIEEDKNKASEFLNEFAEIFRFVLSTNDKIIHPIEDEVIFIQKYFGLYSNKYGYAYQLNIMHHSKGGFIVPLTLQLLVENVIKHNLGSEKNPVFISISIDEEIKVHNNIIQKKNQKKTLGIGLNNLIEQYSILTKKAIVIDRKEDTFTVKIPVITQYIENEDYHY